MIRASEARREARESLNGKWKIAIIISLLYSLIVFAIGFLSGFLGVLGPIIIIANIVIAPPLAYGLAYVYFHLKNGENVQYTDFLKVGFQNFGRSWAIAWAIFCKCWYLIVIPIVLILVIMGIGIWVYTANSIGSVMSKDYLRSSYYDYDDYYDYYDDYDYDYDYYDNDYRYNNGSNSNQLSEKDAKDAIATLMSASVGALLVIFLIFVIYVIIIVFVIRKLLLYALSYYIAVNNENCTPKQAVQESEELMKGNRGRLFSLLLSFIGWSILVVLAEGIFLLVPVIGLILGPIASIIGMSILTPYITFSVLAFYRDLKEGNINNNFNNYQNAYVNSNAGKINYQKNPQENQQNNKQELNFNTYQTIEQNDVKKFCKKCGSENTPDAVYCTKCGEKLDD